jgi:S1-C subfamily serine protease
MGNLGDLKAQQLILLAVFVSFVTSVATGITTVSIIEAAPAPAQQIINRIVERTVERVVPEERPDEDKPVEKEIVTVVVKEEDLAVGAAESVGKSVGRVFPKGTTEFASLALVVGPHALVADAEALALEGEYDVEVNGVRVVGTVERERNGFAVLVTPESAPALQAATIGSAGSLRLAQSLIAVAGRVSPSVATGVLSSVVRGAGEGTPVTSIEASLAGAEILPGTPLANIRGEVVGIRLADGSPAGVFASAEAAAAFAAEE